MNAFAEGATIKSGNKLGSPREEREENENEQEKRFKIDSNVNYVDSLISYRFFAQSIDFVVVVDYANF